VIQWGSCSRSLIWTTGFPERINRARVDGRDFAVQIPIEREAVGSQISSHLRLLNAAGTKQV